MQLYLAIGVPVVLNAAMLTIIATLLSSRMSSLEARLLALEASVNTRFDLVLGKLGELDTRLSVLEERSKR